MPNSMTAFSRQSREFDWGTASWEIRSVNHRFLETFYRLPESVRDLEFQLREQTRKRLNRGKVDCSLQLLLAEQPENADVDLDAAKHCVDAIRQVSELLANPAPVSAMDIIRWPGVIRKSEVDTDTLKSDVLALFLETLETLSADRNREGEKLADIIATRLDAIDQHADEIKKAMPDIIAAQQQKITDRLAELKSELNQDRLEQELVFIAQKADVDEELDRLLLHTAEIRKTLTQSGAIGRRLDFLMQELNREANTLGSKSIAHLSSQTSVELKVLIEQMREQIQNIE